MLCYDSYCLSRQEGLFERRENGAIKHQVGGTFMGSRWGYGTGIGFVWFNVAGIGINGWEVGL